MHRHAVRIPAFGALALAAALSACKPPAQPQMPAPEVRVLTLAASPVELTTELPGRTTPSAVAEIRPQVNGLILERRFVEGSDVAKGSLLYQIDPAPYKSAYDQAAAALANAEAALPALRSRAERLAQLAEIDAAGKQDADDARAALLRGEAAVAAAKAALESARINLAYTPLRAPISGRIGRSNVTAGAMVTAYQPVPLATVQQLDPIYVDVTQSSAELLRLRKLLNAGTIRADESLQRRVRLVLEDGSAHKHEGTFQFRDVTVDPATGSVMLRMVFHNPEHELLPGMYVRAVITEGVNDRAILVPQQAVTRNTKGEATALIVGAGDKVEERIIQTGPARGSSWVVTAGLQPGDRVIVEGLQKVRPGVPVKWTEFKPQPDPQLAATVR
ncbi:MAG: efflux RND transporter periplasmic adaptor subunit [Thermoanaerobaculia bacterium]|nr:efflux RND transporter periplasmic adaptor subunit [Thermoanaerobaculia bacterium]